MQTSAIAFSNIAFIKYWGNRDDQLKLPSTGSISMSLDSLFARTTVSYDLNLDHDTLIINDRPVTGPALVRVQAFQELVRQLSEKHYFARVISENNFPIGAGIASSAAAFAALALASTHAIGLSLSEKDLSRLARRGSGSACRSIPGGFVEWNGDTDETSYAFSIASPNDWRLVDFIAVVDERSKKVGSSAGHILAETSPLQAARIASSAQRLETCRRAILERDLQTLAVVSELDCHMMHAVMMTSQPSLFYWVPASVTVMQAVIAWRKEGLPVFYTLDAGPNVHVICQPEVGKPVKRLIAKLPGVLRVLTAETGGGAHLIDSEL